MEEVKKINDLRYDVFISAYDGCERTIATYNKIKAEKKYWIVFPQYEQNNKD